ncbi:hypothetical protein [Rothia uropygioeca]|uniref:hypothetical protein n=1 Tax=Kocuria sp. 257 TaxID=2021970 RepID=UPI001012E326|nr:hypothetical protein [Kocuria sp. 257]
MYGNRVEPSSPPRYAVQTQSPGTRASNDQPRRASAHPQPASVSSPRTRPQQKSSVGVITGALLVVSILMFVFLHAWVLPQLGASAGVALPELRPLGFPSEAQRVADQLGGQGLQAYSSVHWSWGLVTPIFLSAAWIAMIAASGLKGGLRWFLWTPPILFMLIFLAGSFTTDAALADPAGSGPAVATALILIRWVLLVVLIIEAAWLATRLIRGKLDAFSRGELEGQQPVR